MSNQGDMPDPTWYKLSDLDHIVAGQYPPQIISYDSVKAHTFWFTAKKIFDSTEWKDLIHATSYTWRYKAWVMGLP